jgi:hypothetical protein
MSIASDPQRFRRVAAAVCLVLAPVVEIGAIALMPSISGKGAAQLASVTAHRDAAIASLVLDSIALVLLAGAMAGLATAVGRRFTRWANAGALLAVVGIADLLVMNGINAVATEMVVPGADATQMAALVDRMQASPAWSLILMLSLLVSVGLVLLAVGLFKARAIPRAAAACIAVGAILDGAGFASGTLVVAAAAFAIMLPGFAYAAQTLRSHAGSWRTEATSFAVTPT